MAKEKDHLDSLFDPPTGEETVQVTCTMKVAERDLMEKLCKAHGVSRSKFVAASIRDGIARLKARPIPEAQEEPAEAGKGN